MLTALKALQLFSLPESGVTVFIVLMINDDHFG